MRVKKFEAKSMKEALQMVKQEMGPDAVILSARDNRKKFGIGGDGSVEVTAAVSEQTLHKKKFVESRMNERDLGRFQGSTATLQKKVIATAVERRLRSVELASGQSTASNRLTNEKASPNAARGQSGSSGAGKAITPISYIDISDEDDDISIAKRVERSARRIPAVTRSAAMPAPKLPMKAQSQTQASAQPKSQTLATESFARPTSSIQAASAKLNLLTRGIGQTVERALRSQSEDSVSSDVDGDEAFQYHRLQPEPTTISGVAKKRIQSAAQDALNAGLAAFATDDRQSVIEAKQQHGAQNPATQNVRSLQEEVQRLQKVIENMGRVSNHSFVTPHPGAEFGINFDLSFMYQKLISNGISQDNAVEMLLQCQKELDVLQQKKRPMVDAWIAKRILNQIQVLERPYQARIHVFVGPNGSGKTSTLIKMASQLVVGERKRIAIVTTDTFKVGAVDQLKIFCQILNVPLAIAKSRNEWEWLLQQLGNFDHILTDFPGLQLGEMDEMSQLKALLPPTTAGMTAVHLVLPATGKDSDLMETVRRYKASGFQDLIFTNLDQSVQHGVIYNVQHKANVPLHSFSTGSRIPEDFELATKERVLDLIFKLSRFPKER